MSIPIEIIANNLQKERKSAALSLGEVARRAGIAKSTLSQLESGQGNPSLETLWALCVALNIPFAKLMEAQAQATQVIRYGEQKLDLTPTELRLFNTLLAQPERVFSRDQLIAQAYHDNLDVFDRAVDSHIKNLRKKIALVLPDVDVVQSVYGMGYRYSPPPE